jgi:hypothetical protein
MIFGKFLNVFMDYRSVLSSVYFLLPTSYFCFPLPRLAFAAQSSYDLMERANALYREGKFKQAITLYRKAESRGADPVATSFNIANSYYQSGMYPRGRRHLPQGC